MPAHRSLILLLLALLLLPNVASAQGEGEQAVYRAAPPAIREILDAPPTPEVSLDPTRARMLLVQGLRYPPVADLAQPMLRLAGRRINPDTSGPHQPPRYVGLRLKPIGVGAEQDIALPEDPYLGFPRWSPDGEWFAYTNTTKEGIELWIAESATGQTRRVPRLRINEAYGEAFQWMPGSRTLLCQAVPEIRGEAPEPPRSPIGPVIQETSGRAGPARTYQDLLQTPHDADLFDHYATSQLMLVDVGDLHATRVGEPAVFATIDPAPDGRHLLVSTLRRPYSYLHPAEAFPKEVEVWTLAGKLVYRLASLPLADRVPIEGVPTGPRGWQWRPSQPATLVWIEALDDGDPRKKVDHRDRLLMLPFPFGAEPIELLRLGERFAGITWGARDGLALVSDYDRDRRWLRTFLMIADDPGQPTRLVWDRSLHDGYGDPGSPVLRTLASGQRVLWQEGDSLFLVGQGATPQGDRPFLDRFNLATFESERLFACAEGCYEAPVALVKDDASRIITRHETPGQPPNYFLRAAGEPDPQPLTDFPDPAPQLRGIRKELVTYEREDGVPLSFTLYLPAGHERGERLPTIVWAYPREYVDAGTAGQVSGSPHRFTMIGGISHLFLLTQGYAILDGATMPVVGKPETANDTYVEQLVSSARAAIDKGVELGVTDPERVGVGGHSYGAFMTANLLAHSDLFRAGVARSGAYNRTLTPFGFQSERRTLWEATDTYVRLSPFMAAHKINEPLLLIHGAADNNAGTFPMQSERMYQAIRGNGGTARLVMLPHESHGYAARESVEHTLSEMTEWFDRHVKNAPARKTPEAAAGSE